MSIENEIAKRLFTPIKEEPKEKATVKRARVKRRKPSKEDELVKSISKVVDSYQKRRRNA